MIAQDESILKAIKELGGINPVKIRKAGTYTEWSELPKGLKLRIFRKASSQGPDEIASQLERFGINGESDLLSYLKDRTKTRKETPESSELDLLLAELDAARRELDELRRPKEYEIQFIPSVNGRFIPVRIPIDNSDIPF